MPDRIDDLWSRFTDGRLSPEEAEELASALEADPERLETCLGDAEIASLLGQLSSPADEFVRSFRERLHARAKPSALVEAVKAEITRGASTHAGARPATGARRRALRSRRTGRTTRWFVAASVGLCAVAAALVIVVTLGGGPAEQVRPAKATASRVGPTPAPRELADDTETAARSEAPARPDVPAVETTPGVAAPAAPEAVPEEDAPAPEVEPRPVEARVAEATPGRRHFGYLDATEGNVEVLGPKGHYAPAHVGSALAVGDSVRTRFSRARMCLESGSVLSLNRFTTLALGVGKGRPGLSLVGGEVYVETVPADKGFWVETPHGRAVDLGTRFDVEAVLGRTRVAVVEGTVEVSTDKGKATVKEDHEVLLVRRVSPPGGVRPARDLERRLAWVTAGALAVWKVVFRDDFDRSPVGEWPAGWRRHPPEARRRTEFAVVADRSASGNRCLGCPRLIYYGTQRAYVPIDDWGIGFRLRMRYRPTGPQTTCAGVRITSSAGQGLSIEYDAGAERIELHRLREDKWVVSRRGPLKLTHGQWSAWELRMAEGRMRLTVDGKTVLARPAGVRGRIRAVSLVSRGWDVAEFDDVQVECVFGLREVTPQERGASLE